MRKPAAALLAAMAVAAAVASALPRAEAGDDGLPRFLAPIRADVLARDGRAGFRHSESDLGSPGDAFDARPATVLRTRANPAFLEVAFDRPHEVVSAEAFFAGGAPHEWSLLAGDDPDALRVVFQRRPVNPDAWSAVESFGPPLTARVFRIVAKRLDGGDSVQFGEIALQSSQRPERLEVLLPSGVLCPRGDLPVRARVTWDGGNVSDRAHGLEFETERGSPLRLEPASAVDSVLRTARFEKSGRGRVRAFLPARGERLESDWVEIDCRDRGRPDWTVAFIERTPRLPFDGPNGGLPEPGTSVTWLAHVKDVGEVAAPRAGFAWSVDGGIVKRGELDGLERFAEATEDLTLPWDGQRHEIRFEVDPGDAVPEVSEKNNARAVASDALLLGVWLERPCAVGVDGFLDGGSGAPAGRRRTTACLEDLLQSNVHSFNEALRASRLSIALDRVVVVEGGALPLADGTRTEDPDSRDRTFDLQRGIADGPDIAASEFGQEDTGDRSILFVLGLNLAEAVRQRWLTAPDRLDVHAADLAVLDVDGRPLVDAKRPPTIRDDLVHLRSPGDGWAARRLSEHEFAALARIIAGGGRGAAEADPARKGRYLADLPKTVGLRVLDEGGKPLDGVRVRAWRRVRQPDGRETFTGDPIREGVTADGGTVSLCRGGLDPFFDGRKDGAFDPGQGVLLLELTRDGTTVYRFVDVVPYNLAFWAGETSAHYEEVGIGLAR